MQCHEAHSSSSETSFTNDDVSPGSISFEMQVATSVDHVARSRVISLSRGGIKRGDIDSRVAFTTAR